MPYRIERDGNAGWKVVNTETGDVKGSGMTRENAESQLRLLNAVEHGYKSSGGGN